jgi:glycosyltransferase involved in cell wall biosynthesis
VLCPVPRVPRWLRRRSDRIDAAQPARETWDGIEVLHAPYFHLPGVSLAAQARRIRDASRGLLQRLAGDGPTLLDAHYVYPDGVAALELARELGLPCFVTARGTDMILLAGKPAVRRQLRAVAGVAERFFAVSEDLRRRIVAATGLPDAQVRLARNGVDLERFRPGDRRQARAALGLPADRPLLLAVGRLVAAKGFLPFARRLGAIPGAELVIAGDGPQRRRLARLARTSGRIRLLGPLPPDRVAEACRAADLLVLPSAREGWPNVVTEALASGLPVVAFAVGGVPEILTDARFGRAIRPGDHAAFAAAVRELLAAPPPTADVRSFAERYGWQPTVDLLAAEFRAALR